MIDYDDSRRYRERPEKLHGHVVRSGQRLRGGVVNHLEKELEEAVVLVWALPPGTTTIASAACLLFHGSSSSS
jgi:hypothetical protein